MEQLNICPCEHGKLNQSQVASTGAGLWREGHGASNSSSRTATILSLIAGPPPSTAPGWSGVPAVSVVAESRAGLTPGSTVTPWVPNSSQGLKDSTKSLASSIDENPFRSARLVAKSLRQRVDAPFGVSEPSKLLFMAIVFVTENQVLSPFYLSPIHSHAKHSSTPVSSLTVLGP